jgi:hypothetical protein
MIRLGRLATWALIAVPSLAQTPDPTGIWAIDEETPGGVLTSRLHLRADGSARLETDAELAAESLQLESGAALFPEGLRIAVEATGIWLVDQERLVLSLPERQLRLGDLSFSEALTRLAVVIAVDLAARIGTSASDLPLLISRTEEGLRLRLSEAELLDEALGGLEAGSRFEVSADRLVLTDADGSQAWRRVAPTAVIARAWASVKTTLHGRGLP